jgi:Protein of unknown function (DUF2934)
MSAPRALIAARAYERWVLRGQPEGSPETDWYEAEKDLSRGANDATQAKAPLDPPQQQAPDVLTNESDRGPIATRTETTASDGRIPKRSRPGRNAARQLLNNDAPREQ